MMRVGRKLVLALGILVPGAMLLAQRSAGGAEPLDDRLGVRITPLFLLLRSDIQKDLALEPAQVAEVNQVAPAFYRKALNLKGKKGPGLIAARQAIDAEESRWMNTHLSPGQRERLAQIDLQWEGATALINRPIVAEYLRLTADQQTQVARIISNAQMMRAGPTPWTYELHLETTRKAIALLSEKQRQLWVHVLGPPCHFAITPLPGEPAVEPSGNQASPAPSPPRAN